ncbi:hypothetical protein [Streptomyces sp. NPDC058373]|uniref:hypothetical protein n=1 Tax=unclassified Streptomyces TaxID=2593676 RepID=UPI003663D2A7
MTRSRTHGRALALVAVGVMALTATACTAAKPEVTVPVPPPLPSPSPPRPPEVRPGHVQLAAAGHRGSRGLGAVSLRKGVNWIDLNCRAEKGTELLTFSMAEGESFTVDCPSTEVRLSVNQLELSEAEEDRFTVEVADSVRWYASVQAPDPGATPSPAP